MKMKYSPLWVTLAYSNDSSQSIWRFVLFRILPRTKASPPTWPDPWHKPVEKTWQNDRTTSTKHSMMAALPTPQPPTTTQWTICLLLCLSHQIRNRWFSWKGTIQLTVRKKKRRYFRRKKNINGAREIDGSWDWCKRTRKIGIRLLFRVRLLRSWLNRVNLCPFQTT